MVHYVIISRHRPSTSCYNFTHKYPKIPYFFVKMRLRPDGFGSDLFCFLNTTVRIKTGEFAIIKWPPPMVKFCYLIGKFCSLLMVKFCTNYFSGLITNLSSYVDMAAAVWYNRVIKILLEV